MARYGCTITVAAGKAPSSQSDVAWVATEDNFPTAAIDGGGTSIDNGGGNLRCYTDSTKATQIPIQVVTFVTGGTPSVIVWGLSPTIDVGSTVYIEADTVETSQPAASSTYGSESVWVNSVVSAPLNEAANNTSGGYANSTGGTGGTGVSMSLANPVGPYGGDFSGFNGEPDEIAFPFNSSTSEITVSFWADPDSLTKDQRAITIGNIPNTASSDEMLAVWMDTDGAADGWATLVRNTAATSLVVVGADDSNASLAWQYVSVYVSSTAVSTYVNGTLGSTTNPAFSNGISSANTLTVGRLWTSTGVGNYFNGGIGGVNVVEGDARGKIAIEYNNQSDPSTFWTASAWEDQDTVISITESLVNSNYTSLDPTILLTGSISITESLVNTNYTALDPTINLVGTISVTESLVNVNYDSLDPTITFTGTVSITENLVNTNYTSLDPTVTLTSTAIQITESTVNVQYQSKDPSILLTPEPIGIVSTVCFDGVLVDLVYNGQEISLEYNGQSVSLVFSGQFNELEFNGTIQTTCNTGSINTDC